MPTSFNITQYDSFNNPPSNDGQDRARLAIKQVSTDNMFPEESINLAASLQARNYSIQQNASEAKSAQTQNNLIFLKSRESNLGNLQDLLGKMQSVASNILNNLNNQDISETLATEFNSLKSQYDNIVNSSNVNGTKTLDGSYNGESAIKPAMSSVEWSKVFTKNDGSAIPIDFSSVESAKVTLSGVNGAIQNISKQQAYASSYTIAMQSNEERFSAATENFAAAADSLSGVNSAEAAAFINQARALYTRSLAATEAYQHTQKIANGILDMRSNDKF